MTTITVRSPFRLPLCGGGSDLPQQWRRSGGFLVSVTINQYLTVTVQPDNRMETGPQHDYALAAGWTRRDLLGIASDIPACSGLGGSSSLMVALLRARHPDLQAHELAMAAYHLEHYALGVPCGYQDAFAAAFGGCQALEIDTKGRVSTWPVTLPADFQNRLLLMATGIQRPSADVLARQATSTATSLVCREAMQQIADLGRRIYRDLQDNAGRRYGELTACHWEFKRATCPAISSPVVDAWYDLARANGATGGKLVGAGQGGYLLFVVEPQDRYHLLETMTAAGLAELPFRFTDQRARIIECQPTK
jgi:D-glycero-alpha-D-manno-heptose-7-phosphate kinase